MAKILHVASSISPGGGPAGYLYRLREIVQGQKGLRHQFEFMTLKGRSISLSLRVRNKLFRIWNSALKKAGLRGATDAALRQQLRYVCFRDTADPGLWKDHDVVVLHEIQFAREILRQRRGNAVAVVMQHSPTPFLAELAANIDPKLLLIDYLNKPVFRWALAFELGTYKNADHILAPCLEALEAYRACGPAWENEFSRPKVVLCPTGIAEPIRNSRVGAWRQRLGVPAGKMLGVYVGRYHPHKGPDLILDALKELEPSIRQELFFVFAGFEEPVISFPFARSIGFCDDVPGLISDADFVVNANRYTYFDLASLEVVALGKPLIATRTGGNVALAALAKGVQLVEAGAEDLAKGIGDAVASGVKCLEEHGRQNRQAWERHLSAPCFIERHLEVYDSILRKAG